MSRLFFCLFFGCIFSSSIFCQENKFTKKNAIGVEVGTLGIGIQFSRGLKENMSLKVGARFLDVSDYAIENIEINNENFDVTTNVKSRIFHAVIEYLPFTKSSFKIVGGFGYIAKANLNIDTFYNEEVQIGDILFNREELGSFTNRVSWSGIAPYIGIGFGRALPNKNFGISFELGAFYAGSPDVNFSASGLLTPSGEENAQLIRETLEEIKFLPNLNLTLSYKF